MNNYCGHCDPKRYIIYGFCTYCKRRCACPLYDLKSAMNAFDYEEYKKRWDELSEESTQDVPRKKDMN